MKVIFYKAKYGGLADKLIAWWTSSFKSKLNGDWKESYSHVELLFNDGMMFSASYQDDAVRFAKHNVHSKRWDRVELYFSETQEKLLRLSCEDTERAEYDYVGLTWFVLRLPDREDKWFCSEVVVNKLQRFGYFPGIKAAHVSPNDIARAFLLIDKEK